MASLATLGSVLESVAGDGTLLTIQPGGNYGDRLIYEGFDAFLATTGVHAVPFAGATFRRDAPKYTFPTRDVGRNVSILRNRLQYLANRLRYSPSAVYIHGGGNFNDVWQIGIRCYRLVCRLFDCPVIVGPQSCQFDETDPHALFSGVSNETHFFCRERYSRELLEPVADRVTTLEVYLDDDTALYLDAATLPTGDRSAEYTLVAFRDDRDSADPLVERALNPPLRVRDVSTTAASYEEFVRALARADHVVTDRLHCMILGSILDKRVTAYDTGYHKNRGVYEYSLAGDPDVSFEYL